MKPFIFGVVLAMLAAVEAGGGGPAGGGNTSAGGSGPANSGPTVGGNAGNGGKGGSTGRGGDAKQGGSAQGGTAGSITQNQQGGVNIVGPQAYYGPINAPVSQNVGNQQGGSSIGGAGGNGGNSVGGVSGNGGTGGGSRGGTNTGGPATSGDTSGGKGGNGGKSDGATVTPTFSPTLSIPPPVRRRDLSARDLFIRTQPVYSNGQLYIRAALATAPKGSKAHAGGSHASAGGEISAQQFVSMINNKQKFPPAVEAELEAGAGKGYQPPPNRKPTPAQFANHPATAAIKKLLSGNVPSSILNAINNPANGWSKAGGASKSKSKSKSKGKRAAVHQSYYGAGNAQAGSGPSFDHVYAGRPRGGDDPRLPRFHSLPVQPSFSPQLHTRDAEPEAEYLRTVYVREAEAYPEAYFEERDLYARDAYAEAEAEADAEADAEAEAEADAEAYFEERDLYARDAYPEAYAYADADADAGAYADAYAEAYAEAEAEAEAAIFAREAYPEAYAEYAY